MLLKKNNQSIFNLSLGEVLLLLGFLLVSNLFAVWFVNQERFIYFWDYSGYWVKYIRAGDLFLRNPPAIIKLVWESMRADYNYFPVIFIFPFKLLFGAGRLPYILSVVNIFAFTSAVSFFLLFKEIAQKLNKDLPLSVSFVVLFTLFSFPLFWCPILRGYLDVGCVFFMNLILLVYYKYEFNKQRFRNLAFIGLLVGLLVIFRRYFMIWAVSFYPALLLTELFLSFKGDRFEYKYFKRSLLNVLIIGVTWVAFLLIIAYPMLLKILGSNYSYAYSAYKHTTNLFHFFLLTFKQMGIFYTAFFIVGVFTSIYLVPTRKLGILFTLQFFIITLLFYRIQDFGLHHYYLWIPNMVLFIGLFAAMVLFKIPSKAGRTVVCSVYFITLLAIFLRTFIPLQAQLLPGKTGYLSSGVECYPHTRSDIDDIKKLSDVLSGILEGGNDKLYVLSSSGILNYSILRNAHLVLNSVQNIENHILYSHDIDKKDGFPLTFSTAKYIVVASPMQYHLAPEEHRIMSVLAESILGNTGIGTSYIKLPYEFNLEQNVKVYIYEKVRPFRKEDIESLSYFLRRYYPDKEYIYKINLQG